MFWREPVLSPRLHWMVKRLALPDSLGGSKLTLWASSLVVAHQLYSSWGMLKITHSAPGLFPLCSLVVAGGCVTYLLYQRQQQRQLLGAVLCVILVLTGFVFGSGNQLVIMSIKNGFHTLNVFLDLIDDLSVFDLFM